jgi:hypothetical protein
MTSINLECSWPKTYIHVTQQLLNDQKRHQRVAVYNEIIKDLESELYANKDEDQFYGFAIRAVIERIQSKI